MRLLIAIPVHNEQKYVDRVLDEVLRYHDQILVVDDGSTDATPDLLARRTDVRVLTHRPNRGYGKSLIDAFAYADRAGYDWVVTMDCDEQHEPARIPDFVRAICADRWDLISGSRYLAASGGDDLPPPDRRTVNMTITAAINDLYPHLNLTDAFCGYKAHRVSAMRRLNLTEAGYAFPMQLWPQVVKAGLRVTEIPVRLIYNDPNRSFGGNLDDMQVRLNHYLDVLRREVAAPLPAVADDADEPDEVAAAAGECCGCGCK